MNFPNRALVEEVLLLTLMMLLRDFDPRLHFGDSRLRNLRFKKFLIFSELTFAQVKVSNELLLHVDIPHDV